MSQHRRTMLFCLVLTLSITPDTFAQFSRLVVFGDSLSDVGNLNSATFGLQPGGEYFEGRFSNGPVYSEQLADKLNLGPLLATSDDGTNYAYAGSRTSGTSFFEGGLFIEDLDEQIDDFLENDSVSSDDLVVVFAGANDFILGDATNAAGRANRVLTQLDRLIDANVKNIVSLTIPLLGETPDGRANRESLNGRATTFNATLQTGLDALETSDLNLIRLDLAELFNVLLENPNTFGFDNITNQAINASNPEGYLYWDGNHPTTRAHSMIAEAVFRQVQGITAFGGDFDFDDQISSMDADLLGLQILRSPTRLSFDLNSDQDLTTADMDALLSLASTRNGDTDFSGEVDFPDFLALSRGFGRTDDQLRWSSGDFDSNGSVEFVDFLILSRNFGMQGPTATLPSVVSIPEPGQIAIWMGTLCLLQVRFRRRRRRTLLGPACGEANEE